MNLLDDFVSEEIGLDPGPIAEGCSKPAVDITLTAQSHALHL